MIQHEDDTTTDDGEGWTADEIAENGDDIESYFE